MKLIHLAALILLGSIWGASFLFIRVAAPVLGPLPLMGARVFIAGAALFVYAAVLRQLPDLRGRWRDVLVVGALNSAFPFVLIAAASLTLTASLASILNSTTPLFTAVIAAAWLKKPLSMRVWLGVGLGITGVTVLVGGAPLAFNAQLLLAALASLSAAFCYGLGNVYASQHFNGVAPLHSALAQMLGATVLLTLPALATLPDTPPTPGAIGSLLALALVSTSFATLIYFYLINHIGPTRTSTVTFLVPVFGTCWGILFLQEPFTPGILLGMGLILLSVSQVLELRVDLWRRTAPQSAD